MNPKRVKDFYKPTAEQLDVSKEYVEDAIQMYWKEVRKAITEMKYHAIKVDGLGTFKVKHWKLPEMKEKFQKIISCNDGTSFRKMSIKSDYEKMILMVEHLETTVKEEQLRQQSIKDKRNEKVSNHLEEQVSDTRGLPKQDSEERSGREDLPKETEDM